LIGKRPALGPPRDFAGVHIKAGLAIEIVLAIEQPDPALIALTVLYPLHFLDGTKGAPATTVLSLDDGVPGTRGARDDVPISVDRNGRSGVKVDGGALPQLAAGHAGLA